MIREFWRFLRSTPRVANVFALATLALWVLKAVYLDDLPSPFPKAYEIGRVFEGLLSAIVAGWIFYLFFALLPEWRQKTIVAPFVLRKVGLIAGDCEAILEELGRAAGQAMSFSRVTHDEIERALAKIPFKSQPKVSGGGHKAANWLELFRYRREHTEQAAGEIIAQSRFVDPEIVALSLRTRESPFFIMARSMERFDASYKYLSVLSDNFFTYLLDCRSLAQWHDANCIGITDPLLPHLG
jgi:hypothetical protein